METTTRKTRDIIGWKRFIETHKLELKDSLFKEKAVEAFESELGTFLEARLAGKKAKGINKADIEIPQELIDAVNNTYEKHGTPRSVTIDGHEVAGKHMDYATLVGYVATQLATEPANYPIMMNQIRAYQLDRTVFTEPKKGKGGGQLYLEQRKTRSQLHGEAQAKEKSKTVTKK